MTTALDTGARSAPDDAELVRMDGMAPMFAFTDPVGNGLVHLEDTAS